MVDFGINLERDTSRSQPGRPEHERILHICDGHWHGIRSATGCLPGQKLIISHKRNLTGDEIRYVFGMIHKLGVTAIAYQGYSRTADTLARAIHSSFGTDIRQVSVSHCSSAQFENHFEMEMQGVISQRKRERIFEQCYSVKPQFNSVNPAVLLSSWPTASHHFSPMSPIQIRDITAALCPVENTWRKNSIRTYFLQIGPQNLIPFTQSISPLA